MQGYTTTDLLNSVKTRGMLPDASTGSLSPDNLLELASEELHTVMVPMILAAREHYYEKLLDQTVVALNGVYSIPDRAIGGTLASVQYIYGINIIMLTPIEPASVTTIYPGLSPRGFYFQNNSIVLYPIPSTTNYTLRMRYFQRPSKLAQTINCGQVTAFDPIGNTITVSSIPSSWTTGTVVDFVPSLLPYTPYALDQTITGVAGNVISFTTIPTTIAVGDWLAIAGFTPIPELPVEMFPVLAQCTVCKALEALGDAAGLQAAQANLQVKVSNALKLITSRDQSGPKKICSGWRNL